ncbi:hypothetical protein DB728_09145 [Rhizobium leguminosarum bv. viciae USDA 2370]|nr:hypothetical protein BS629_26555 [Rhizobium leguminosarum bv. viciae USDA 2370]PUB64875.1 hypothetical protein DB728_09145 [Rhizobium leguminosarum bv. viciae USDA 2370]
MEQAREGIITGLPPVLRLMDIAFGVDSVMATGIITPQAQLAPASSASATARLMASRSMRFLRIARSVAIQVVGIVQC